MPRMLTNSKTNKQDVMLTLVFYAVIVAGIKFIMEGVSFSVMGHVLNLGHTDAATYAAFLTPILGTHGFIDSKTPHLTQPPKVDDPDAN